MFTITRLLCSENRLLAPTWLKTTFLKNWVHSSPSSKFFQMYSLRTVFIFCVRRRYFIKLFSQDQTLALFSASFSTCSRLCRKQFKPLSSFFTPAPVKVPLNEAYAGEELSGEVTKIQIIQTLNKFFSAPELKSLVEENGLDDTIFRKGAASFRKFCILSKQLPTELHVTLYDVVKGSKNSLSLFPYFLSHVREIFPHLEYMEDLKKIGDLRFPANWYPEARNMKRKIYFHCGPTNSGKTYHAVQKFLLAKSGIYCGPLKLLAVEVFQKSNEKGTACDLITGEEIINVQPDGDCANHISCTVEMCSLEKTFDIAVIDEIQMIKDPSRGWAWTRALLGLQAKEIYVCGEEAAVDLIQSILSTTNEELEIRKYQRLTNLTVSEPLQDLKNVQSGDCIVCFNKKDIYSVTLYLEHLGQEVAVIYGSLPPGTKTSQCAKFNDPNDPCKIMVATDAIGMGLNLSIRRIIFYSITKPSVNEKGEIENVPISVSQALQIAGRAGRYGSRYSKGLVTTFRSKDLAILKNLLSQPPEPVLSAGLLPTLGQIEMYSYYLPHSKLSELIDIFVTLSTVDDSTYFMCDQKVFKTLAQMIEHFNLPLTVKYVFCCAPIDIKGKFLCVLFLKFAKMFSENRTVSFGWLAKEIAWPPKTPKDLKQLQKLEEIHDAMDLYLWLSYRFPEYFSDGEVVKKMQKTVDLIIQEGVLRIAPLLRAPLQDEYDPLYPEDDLLTTNYENKKFFTSQKFLETNCENSIEGGIKTERQKKKACTSSDLK